MIIVHSLHIRNLHGNPTRGCFFGEVEIHCFPPMDRDKKEGQAAVKGYEEEENKEQREEISENSSSIGVNSDEENMDIEQEGDGGSSEVQSSAFGSLSSLDSALPGRKRGLSEFFDGGTKSYTNLTEGCGSESVKDIAKPDDAYRVTRRNEMARNIILSSKFSKTSAGGGIRTGGEMSSLDTPTNTNQTSPGGNTENLASSAPRPMYHVPLHLRVGHESSSSPSRDASTFTPGRSLLSHESSSSPSRNASTFTPERSSSSFAELHGVAAGDESNSRIRVDTSSTSFQSATPAAAASDNTRRPDNLESAVADDGSDPDRRPNNSTTSSNNGVDTKESQK